MNKYAQYLQRVESQEKERSRIKNLFYMKQHCETISEELATVKLRYEKATDEEIRKYVYNTVKLTGWKYSILDINNAINNEGKIKHSGIIRFVYDYYTCINQETPDEVTEDDYVIIHEKLGLKPEEKINPSAAISDINASINKNLASYFFIRMYVKNSVHNLVWVLLLNKALLHNKNGFLSVPYRAQSKLNNYVKRGIPLDKLDEIVRFIEDVSFSKSNPELDGITYKEYSLIISKGIVRRELYNYLKDIGENIPSIIRVYFSSNNIIAGAQFITR